MKSPEPDGQPSRLWWPVVAGLALLYVGIAGFNVAFGAMNVDEGFYAAAARAVWQGEMPYRDFGYTQMPLLPCVNGLAMGLTRFGLFEQRIINGIWGLLALLLGARLLWRREAAWGAVLLFALFTLSPAWMYLANLGKTYGLVSLVVMAAVTVWLDWTAGWKKSTVLSLLAVIGVGCRLPAAPFFGVLWLAALWDGDGFNWRRLAVATASLAIGAAGLLLPFYALAPDQTRFWIVDFHRVSVPLRDWHVRWEEIVALAPGVWSLMIFVFGAGLMVRRRWPWRESATVAAALAALAVNLLPQGAYEEYGVPFLPPLAVATLLLLPPGVVAWRVSRRWLAGLALLLVPLVLIPVLCGHYRGQQKRAFPSIWLPLNVRPYNYKLPANIRHGREVVARALSTDQPYYGPAIILAIEADRPIPRRLRMGAFTMTSDFAEEKADRLHLMTDTELLRLVVSSPVPLLGLHSQPEFNYAWSVPSFRYRSEAERRKWSLVFDRRFRIESQDEDFVLMSSRF